MPKCAECGIELPREELFGTAGDFRCPKCADRRRRAYEPPKLRDVRGSGRISIALILVSAMASVGYWSSQEWFAFLGALPPMVWNGEVWRILTSTLLHADTLHLAFNCFWVWRFGGVLEAWMGPWRYLGFLLMTAAASSAGAFLIEGPAIGLSGVVYAMFGLLFALRRDKGFAAEQMQPQVLQLLFGWFIVCFFLSSAGVMRIANAGHVSGLLLGYALGWVLLQKWRGWGVGALAATSAALLLACLYMPWSAEYSVYQARRSFAAGDRAAAQAWLERAQELDPRLHRREQFDPEE